jgi:hypothetical protein
MGAVSALHNWNADYHNVSVLKFRTGCKYGSDSGVPDSLEGFLVPMDGHNYWINHFDWISQGSITRMVGAAGQAILDYNATMAPNPTPFEPWDGRTAQPVTPAMTDAARRFCSVATWWVANVSETRAKSMIEMWTLMSFA